MGTTALYARLSRDRQEGAGIERQLADCHDLAERNGWTPVKEYKDESISASRFSTKPRPAYDAMIAAAERGELDRVICWHLDRLYRRPHELEPVINLADRGLIVVTVEHGDLDLTTGDGRYNARIVVAGAAKMSDDTSRRVRRAKAQNRERGLQHGGKTPVGWVGRWRASETPGGKPTFALAPLPAEVEALRNAMERVVAGASLRDVAADWTRSGLRGRSWSGNNVRRVLSLPRHVALVPVNGSEWMHDKDGNEIKAQWPAIVPRQLWDDCRAVLAARATNVGVVRRRSLLTARLTCGNCGTMMTRSTADQRSIWRCWNGYGGCGQVSIGADAVEAVILDELFRRVDDSKLVDAMRQIKNTGRATVEVRRELDALARRRRELVDAFEDRGGYGGLSASAYLVAAERLEAQRKELDIKLGKLITHSPLERFVGPGVLRSAWPDLSVDEQRDILVAVYPRIVIQPAAVRGRRFDASRIELG